ncbi:MAG: hypothetical protein HQ567_07450 [Candidatus Nealsonbacteria bacterium]|nr:hypothetical protein [Candidatus Nealsonbacteria bacterium]
MQKLSPAMLCLLLLSATVGCQSMAPANRRLGAPGSPQPQATAPAPYAAWQRDPFPDKQMAPEIVGGRPMGFSDPPAEVLRVQPPLDPLQTRQFPWHQRRP